MPVFNEPVVGNDDNPPTGHGVKGVSKKPLGVGVVGFSESRYGVLGESIAGPEIAGVIGRAGTIEVGTGIGVGGSTKGAEFDHNINNVGVYGTATDGLGVYGYSDSNRGVYGYSKSYSGVYGRSESQAGVFGISFANNNAGVYGYNAHGYGVYGFSQNEAGHFQGNVKIEGTLKVTGNICKDGGGFQIDHPLDPANKYLSHSFVESPDMKNVYDGVVVLDDKGEAVIELPDWFGAVNKDFRYQLTAIGAPGPNLYISEEIPDASTTTTNYSRTRSSNSNKNKNKNNDSSSRFKVAGGNSGMKVSWQVTGIRKDPWANAHRIPIEEDKPAKERGYYRYPELYGQPEEKGISRLLDPEIEKELLVNNQNKRPKRKILSS
jgi:hypothetical protein